jgi:hypothetical protein
LKLAAASLEQGQARRAKSTVKLKDIWAIRVRLELADRKRELALFNLAALTGTLCGKMTSVQSVSHNKVDNPRRRLRC